ncbi:MAG: HAD family hydrolase [Treponema sp.]|nr:HAD family hydrolase [Treponema sp.]
MKYKLAIFDLDGTILDTLSDLADSVNAICKKYNYPEHTKEEIKWMVGNGIPKLIQRALPKDVPEPQYKIILADFISYYQEHSSIKTKPYEGIEDLLKMLRSKGIKTAVNSNKAHEASVLLCQKYFPGLFDIVCGFKEGFEPKPAPDGLKEILAATNSTPENSVYIGDSDVDYLTGTNAGLDFIGVEWGFRGAEFLKEHGAKKIASSAKELAAMLNS